MFDRNFPENCNLICFGLGLSPQNENKEWEFKNAAILPRQCYYGNIVAPIPLHAYMFSCDTSMRTYFATVFL